MSASSPAIVPPVWLIALSWAALAVAPAGAAWITLDILGRGYRQHVTIMEAVWPVTALYSGPVAVAAYRPWGRPVRLDGDHVLRAVPCPHHLRPDSPVCWFLMQSG